MTDTPLTRLQQINGLQQAIETHGKLSADVLKKITYKFRLEWNYYSNRIEGNTLTLDETRAVMVNNLNIKNKSFREVAEMRGHDEVVVQALSMGRGELNISEKRIKDIHRAIIHEEDPAKRREVGTWKKAPNYLYNYRGERFDFTPPEEVPDAMHKLINWLSAEREKIQRKTRDALHPAILAFRFQLQYVSIHPFYDGNGRTARILTNLILIAYGYPPVYVKDEDCEAYSRYLADIQAYGENPTLFLDFMCNLLIRSQQTMLEPGLS
ncbi:MAG: Fic family protein [Bacteroidia bacterium]|nr:Fic family protein [Bacteroidia bacterium]